jgi:hypothetical protein
VHRLQNNGLTPLQRRSAARKIANTSLRAGEYRVDCACRRICVVIELAGWMVLFGSRAKLVRAIETPARGAIE